MPAPNVADIWLAFPVQALFASSLSIIDSLLASDCEPKVTILVAFSELSRDPTRQPSPLSYCSNAKFCDMSSQPVSSVPLDGNLTRTLRPAVPNEPPC